MERKISTLRVEGPAKLTGKAKYIDDMSFPEMLHGATVRSPIPRGVLKEVIYGEGIPWDEFVIVTAKDIPGKNFITMIEPDWPFLVEKEINHHGEAVALIAHSDIHLLRKALSHIEVVVDEKTPVFEIEESEKKKEVIWGKDNVLKSYLIEKGDVESVWDKADHIIEDTYYTGAQEQLYIETNGMIATANDEEGVTIWGSLQCPYYVHAAIHPLFDLPKEKVRIIQAETGGGFGGKEEFPSLLAGHASLLAWKSGKPVKMIYSRTEDMANSTKRHPSRSVHKMAVSKEGKILGWDIDFVLDGGAYFTLSSVVLSRGCIHAPGPYYCENTRVNARAVATNKFPFGAFRGFGAPQSIFATERFMDKVARQIGMDPIEFRKINFIKPGQTTATGQKIEEVVDFEKLIDKALSENNYHAKKELYKKENADSHIKKGIGLATFMHGAGFTGSGETYLASIVDVVGTKEGKIEVLASSVEMGQGKNTVFSEIAAKALGVELTDIDVVMPDTGRVPDSGPTVASRTSMVVGGLVESACLGLKKTLMGEMKLKENYSRDDFINALKNYTEKNGNLKSRVQYKQPPNVEWNEETYQGAAYATYAWAVYLADLEIDTLTYETKVNEFIAVQEVGNVLNPVLAAGQIEGGVAQAIGYGIYEKVNYQNGVMVNNQMTNYIMPTAGDVPDIKVFFEEWNKEYGPGGAKGIGELPMDGPAPAIINAVEDAINISVNSIPMLPEDLFEKMTGEVSQ